MQVSPGPWEKHVGDEESNDSHLPSPVPLNRADSLTHHRALG